MENEDGKVRTGAGGRAIGVAPPRWRGASAADIEKGLKITSLFPANAIDAGELFSVLGAGWSYWSFPSLPATNQKVDMLCVVETGSIADDTQLRFDYAVEDGEGKTVLTSHFDLKIKPSRIKVRRWPIALNMVVDFGVVGVWRFKVSSGGLPLASYDLEILLEG